jgi:predicted outer membrane repeat protein
MEHPMRAPLAALLLAFLLSEPSAAQLHVNRGNPISGDGSSWAQAFRTLEEAFAVSVPGSEIWVRAGWYTPNLALDLTDRRTRTFNLPVDVRLYGGFDGTETSLAQRAGLFSATVLSGDVGIAGDASDNVYHVVSAQNLPPTLFAGVVIDGFTIRDGNADGTGPHQDLGGGLYVFNVYGSVKVVNCIFLRNNAVRGGAIGTPLGYLHLRDTRFVRNTATHGGAIHLRASSLLGYNLVFESNSATNNGGAVFSANQSSANWSCVSMPRGTVLVNSLFHRNSAGLDGGAVFTRRGSQQGMLIIVSGESNLVNCTFAYNTAGGDGGALSCDPDPNVPARMTVRNSIAFFNYAGGQSAQIHGPAVVSYSNVQGGFAGAGNIAANPLFVNPANLDYALQAASPAIDAGNSGFLLEDLLDLDDDGDPCEPVPLDLRRAPRLSNANVDMGAIERQ